MAADDREVEDRSLSAIVAAELRQAQTFDQAKRALAIKYMSGDMPDLPARPNGSSQTSRDVADTISWILPGVLRVFAASDQMVQFQATQEGGEQGAEEASEYHNYSFFRENEGYRILYNATYDSLLMGNGAACSYWEPEKATTKTFRDRLPEEVAALLEEGWQGTGVQPSPGQPREVDDPLGEPTPTITVKLKRVKCRAQIRDMTCKPENLLLSAEATTIEGARMAAYYHDDKTRSDLMEMADEYGWDKAVIEDLPAESPAIDNNEVSQARRPDLSVTRNSPLKSGDAIGLYEVYILADEDGDGIAERLQAWYAGTMGAGQLLGSEEWDDDVPFTDIPCYPVPHRWDADSVFDREADIQRVKTALLRQGLDNTYAVNQPMREVEEKSVLNPDILVNPRFGGLIWKKQGSAPILPQVVPYIADKAFAAMEYMDTITARRTGVSKTTMALDPETLQNQSATGSQLQHDAGYSQIELIARNMAELGWAKFFAKRLNLARKYITEPMKIPSKNGDAPPPQMPAQPGQPAPQPSKYRTIQPAQWADNMACTINVGLGTGSRDRDMQMLNLILNGQVAMADRLGAAGFIGKAIEFIPKIRKTAVEMAESSGLRNPDDYYPPIGDDEVVQMQQEAQQRAAQPDPKLQIEQMKAQAAMQIQQSEQQSNQIKAQAEIQKSQADAQVKQLESRLALQQQQFEAWKAQEELKFKQLQMEVQSQTELRKAAWSNLTSLEIARIGASKDTAPEPGPVEAELESIVGVKNATQVRDEQITTALQNVHGALAAVHQSLAAPTEIVRDASGKAVGARKVVN